MRDVLAPLMRSGLEPSHTDPTPSPGRGEGIRLKIYSRSMSAAVPQSIPGNRIRAVEWESGRLQLADRRLLPGRREHIYPGPHADCRIHVNEVSVTHRRCHENHPIALFQILGDAATIYYHGTAVAIHG